MTYYLNSEIKCHVKYISSFQNSFLQLYNLNDGYDEQKS